MIKDGYHLAIDVSELTSIKKKDETSLYLADRIFASNSNKELKDVLNKYPDDFKEKITYTDIFSKTGK